MISHQMLNVADDDSDEEELAQTGKKANHSGGITNLNSLRRWQVAKDKNPERIVRLEHILGFEPNASIANYERAATLITCGKVICNVCAVLLTATKKTVHRHQVTQAHVNRLQTNKFATMDPGALDELIDTVKASATTNQMPTVEDITGKKRDNSATIDVNTSSSAVKVSDPNIDFKKFRKLAVANSTSTGVGADHSGPMGATSMSADISRFNSNTSSQAYTLDPASRIKRSDGVIAWDDYFMAVAYLSGMRSKDPSTQVGACIVNRDKRIVGIGYNGFPAGCSDDELPWARVADNELDTKYPYVCHAEINAVLNKNSAEVRDCTLYVGLFPCNECAKVIIQSGIREVVFISDKHKQHNSMKAARKMFGMAKVMLRQHTPKMQAVTIDFTKIQQDIS